MPISISLHRLRRAALFGLCAALAVPAAGVLPAHATPVVQPLPGPATDELADALQRLSANPHSVPALVSAGRASLQLDDVEAARGFFERAKAIAPDDGRVLAGLALVSLRKADAVSALDLFRQAAAAGEDIDAYASQRGLAEDLVGNNAEAQRLYKLALAQGENDETVRRLALSYAISGDQPASEATLLPLLQQRDLAAYRTRAFALAILGKEQQAVSIIRTMLPDDLAQRLVPYMRKMPRLTHAQQAAAANLGRFPPESQIGHDDRRLVRAARRERTAIARAASAPASVRRPAVPQTRAEQVRQQQEGITPVPAAATGQPVTVAQAAREQAPASPPAPTPGPTAEPTAQPDLGEVFSDVARARRTPATRARRGAVDMRKIEPTREAPPKPPPPPPVPSRVWVQVGVGRNTHALPFTWHRIVRRADGLLDGKHAYRARMGRTNRLVTGPFDSAAAAQRMVRELKRKGIDSFRFTSARGEEVVRVD